MEDTGEPSFDLTFPQLNTSGRWTPRGAEVQLCHDIVASVNYPIPASDAEPLARYVTMATFFYDAMDAARAMPPGALPAAPNGALPRDSLSVLLMDATVAANEIVRNRFILALPVEAVRERADDLQPAVVAFRRAIGTVGGADESFWTPAAPGKEPLYTIGPPMPGASQMMPPSAPGDPKPEPAPRARRRWWQRR